MEKAPNEIDHRALDVLGQYFSILYPDKDTPQNTKIFFDDDFDELSPLIGVIQYMRDDVDVEDLKRWQDIFGRIQEIREKNHGQMSIHWDQENLEELQEVSQLPIRGTFLEELLYTELVRYKERMEWRIQRLGDSSSIDRIRDPFFLLVMFSDSDRLHNVLVDEVMNTYRRIGNRSELLRELLSEPETIHSRLFSFESLLKMEDLPKDVRRRLIRDLQRFRGIIMRENEFVRRELMSTETLKGKFRGEIRGRRSSLLYRKLLNEYWIKLIESLLD